MKKRITAMMMFALAGCATPAATPSVPARLKAPAGEQLTLETVATGVQIYECSAGKWNFKAPEAHLFDRSGNKIGTHYAGPTWESNDGSKVVAAIAARSDAPDANAIPWLLLSAKSTAGSGVFDRTKSIQRVSTVGGTTPTDPCTQADAGKVARVAYQAVYYFYQ
ncbi:MAG: DUF3455 domain-containing protein [Burkholderiales bacterium]